MATSSRWACVLVLGALGWAIPALAESPEDRARIRDLIEGLRSPYMTEREAATQALVALGDPALAPLREALRDPDFRVRAAAADALGRLGAVEAIAALLQAAETDEAEVRAAASAALVRIGAAAREKVEERLGAAPGSAPLQEALAAFVALDVEKALNALITDRYSYGFYAGQFARITAMGERAIPIVLAMYTRPGYDFRETDPKRRHIMRALAGEALAEVGHPSIVPTLLDVLRSNTSAAELGLDRQDLEDTVCYVLFKLGEKAWLEDLMVRLDNYMDVSSEPDQLQSRLVGLQVRAGRYQEAERHYRAIIERGDQRAGWAHYNLACLYAIQKKIREALDELRVAIREEFGDVDWIKLDGDLANLHGNPEYEELIRVAEENDRGANRNNQPPKRK